ncbi:MAG: HAMP domain-containing sensor histidine kinase, partial [Gemmatimonadaceae bacterium]
MTPRPHYDLAGSRRSRSWSNWLWVLAGVLLLLTALHVPTVVHDDRVWRAALRATAQATAEQHAERINERLQFFATETFAPVVRYGRSESSSANANGDLAQLVSAQITNEKCQCKTTLPVAEFFRASVDTQTRDGVGAKGAGVITRKSSGGAASASTALTDSLLLAIARAHITRSNNDRAQSVYLTFDATTQGYAVATTLQRDSGERTHEVYGFITRGHPLMRTLFGVSLVHAGGTARRDPDTLSVQIGLSDSSPLYGKLSDDRPYRGKVVLHGPMDGLGVSVALSSSQARLGQATPPTDRIWALGLLSLGTILVILIAISSQRRETFLARARSDFIAGTSHDLRMPLAQILLASETLSLRPEVSSDERTGLSKSIVRETHRLIAMVENLLLFSRSGAVEIKASLKPLNVLEIFEDVRDAVHLAAEDARQNLALSVHSDLYVMADRQ